MQYLKVIFGFVGTLLPVVFPDNEFQPKRLGAVMALLIVIGFGVYIFDVTTAASIIDMTGDAIELTEG